MGGRTVRTDLEWQINYASSLPFIDASATAWAFLVGYCTSMYFTAEYGGGVHQWDVPLGRVLEFAKVNFRHSRDAHYMLRSRTQEPL